MSDYIIIDEPRPSALARFTVNPMWPLFAFMFGGAFFSWLWSILNSFALGSANKTKEIALVIVGISGFFCVILGAYFLVSIGVIEKINRDYFQLVLVLVELAVCYTLYVLQSPSFSIYEYFNGKVMSGIPGLILAYLVGYKMQTYIVDFVFRLLPI